MNIEVIEIRSCANGFVVTAAQSIPRQGYVGVYVTYVCQSHEAGDLNKVIEQVLTEHPISQSQCIPPPRGMGE